MMHSECFELSGVGGFLYFEVMPSSCSHPASHDQASDLWNRRRFLQAAVAGVAWRGMHCLKPSSLLAQSDAFELRYCLASCMYGQLPLHTILSEVSKTGASAIDLWPQKHGNQREQAESMGWEAFASLLDQKQLKAGCLTRYDLGPFGLDSECAIAGRLDCPLIVTGGRGPVGLQGQDLKRAVGDFVEQMKPHLSVAQSHGVRIAIENHGHNLIDHPDSLKWLVELGHEHGLGVALAPYHLEHYGMGAQALGQLITDLGAGLDMFYAWQYGMGCMKLLPKEQELLQMPGRGSLDFVPILKALRKIRFKGWTEIFMHPVPRGIPILPSAEETTQEINRARSYLARCLNPIQ